MVTRTKSSTRQAPIARLWLAVWCGYLALGATVQSIPDWVRLRFGGGPLLTGTAVAIAFLATAAMRPIAGTLGDLGKSRVTVICGALATAVGGFGQLLAPDPAVLLAARVVMGAGEAALFSAALPWVLRGVGSGARTAGWFGLSMWGGLAMGPVLAELVSDYAGVRAVWFFVSGLGVLSAILVCTTVDRTTPTATSWPRAAELIPSGSGLPGLLIGFGAYGYGSIAALLVLFLRTQRLGGSGVVLAVFGAAFLLARVVCSPLVDRFGARPMLLASLVVQAVGLLGIALADTVGIALVATALAGVGLAVLYPAAVSLTLARTSTNRRGAALASMTSYWDLGILVAGPVGGAVVTVSGYPLAFTVAAGCALIALVLIGTYRVSQVSET